MIIKNYFNRKPNLNINFSNELIVSPCDSRIKRIRQIKNGIIFGKGNEIKLESILKNETKFFDNGVYINQYLAPYNIHSVYFPCNGKIITDLYCNSKKSYPVLYDRRGEIENERLVSFIETDYGFNIGMIMIGSIIPLWNKKIGIEKGYVVNQIYKKGDYYGRFTLGSTVILLFPENKVKMLINENQCVKIGESIAKLK